MWLDELRERWQATLEQRGLCPRCASVWVSGTCVALTLEGALGALDTVQLSLSGTLMAGPADRRLPSGVSALPVNVPLVLPPQVQGDHS